jgi:hypothetical protein
LISPVKTPVLPAKLPFIPNTTTEKLQQPIALCYKSKHMISATITAATIQANNARITFHDYRIQKAPFLTRIIQSIKNRKKVKRLHSDEPWLLL